MWAASGINLADTDQPGAKFDPNRSSLAGIEQIWAGMAEIHPDVTGIDRNLRPDLGRFRPNSAWQVSTDFGLGTQQHGTIQTAPKEVER